jgi:Ca2+-binding EF-hand superfamily protein
LIKFYDLDGDGQVSYEEFLRGLRDEMTPRRAKMVEKIFKSMDRDGSGVINLGDVIQIYDVSTNAEFIAHKKTKEQILQEFLNNFEGAKGNRDGQVTYSEFFDYYTDLSMSVPNDEYFVRMLESAWQIPEADNDPVAEASIKMLIKEVRARVLELAKNDPKLIKKIHSDFDLNQSGALTIDEVTNMIAKLKISVERKYVHPFFKYIDQDNSGNIDYPEFEKYILG